MPRKPPQKSQDAPDPSQGIICLTPGDPQTERVYHALGAYPSVPANSGGGQNRQAILVTRRRRKSEN